MYDCGNFLSNGSLASKNRKPVAIEIFISLFYIKLSVGNLWIEKIIAMIAEAAR